ncbi:NUDIX domain-containing protein [Deinococcus deserti]
MMLDGVRFSLRAVILCIRDGHLLVNRTAGDDFWFLPGGAAGIGEDTRLAAAREWQEETGLAAGPMQLVGVVENFFGAPPRREHEVGFYYRMDAPTELPGGSFQLADNPDVQAEWLPV